MVRYGLTVACWIAKWEVRTSNSGQGRNFDRGDYITIIFHLWATDAMWYNDNISYFLGAVMLRASLNSQFR